VHYAVGHRDLQDLYPAGVETTNCTPCNVLAPAHRIGLYSVVSLLYRHVLNSMCRPHMTRLSQLNNAMHCATMPSNRRAFATMYSKVCEISDITWIRLDFWVFVIFVGLQHSEANNFKERLTNSTVIAAMISILGEQCKNIITDVRSNACICVSMIVTSQGRRHNCICKHQPQISKHISLPLASYTNRKPSMVASTCSPGMQKINKCSSLYMQQTRVSNIG